MQSVLNHFKVEKPAAPTLSFLTDLLTRYTETVPWGSTCRISRKQRPQAERPRFAEAFWQDVTEHGGDGTCFESNYAFFALLRWLGYEGYLTLNNMGETVGCHSAIVLHINGAKWLVDVGLPIYAPLRLDNNHITTARSQWHEYAAIPAADGTTYAIERSHHPRPNCFTLIDQPVDDATYRERLARDHEPDGLFLDKVILHKIIDGSIWRYNGRDAHPTLEEFPPRQPARQHPITGDLTEALAARFGVSEVILRVAFVNEKKT